MDKCCSALNGTPPGIPRLYCRVQMPFDLSETELFLPRAQMQEAIAACDEQGWNQKGEIYCGTCYRVSLQIYMVKEEILEGALGVDIPVSRERIDLLLTRTSALSQNRPQQFQFNSASTGRLLFVQLTVDLETLQNMFLLHRLALVNHLEGNNNQGLLDTAMEMLEKVIMMWEKRDKLMGFEFCFDWFVTSYGVPAAEVICVDLLKLTSSSKSSSSSSSKPHSRVETITARFSKSVAIQKLTLFAAFLDWIRDTDGNYALLKRVRGVVGRVLKWVLDGGEVSREMDKEKEKEKEEERAVSSQTMIPSVVTQMSDPSIENAAANAGITDQPPDWNVDASVGFLPQPTGSEQPVLDDDFTASLDFNTGLESLEGIGMEEMWGQVDWLNAGDWMGGSGSGGVGGGVGGAGNGSAGFGFGF